jgi:hypothetical protein
MAKSMKSMGMEYQIAVQGDWEQIAEAARTGKQLIRSSRESISPKLASGLMRFGLVGLLPDDERKLEERILGVIMVPGETESFPD